MPKRLLIMGPQGVGKGTQATKLAAKLGVPAISTGDIFRSNIKEQTELGKRAHLFISQGMLVPDELTNSLIEDAIASENGIGKDGFILDGFPRNATQVEALDEILNRNNIQLDAVVNLTAPREILLERMLHRAEVEGREDDTPEAISKRLEIYDAETAPLNAIYEERGLLKNVDGTGSIDAVEQAINELLA